MHAGIEYKKPLESIQYYIPTYLSNHYEQIINLLKSFNIRFEFQRMEQEVLQEKQKCPAFLSRFDKTNKPNKSVGECPQETTTKNYIVQMDNTPEKNLVPTIRKTFLTYDLYESNVDLMNNSSTNIVSYHQAVDNEHKNSKKKESLMKSEIEDYLESQEEQHARSIINGNPPLSREFSALRKSVTDSKVLSEFFTETDIKLRNKDGLKDASIIKNQSNLQHKKRKHRKNVSIRANQNEKLCYPRRSRSKCSLIKHTNISFNCFHSQSSINYPEKITLKTLDRRSNLRSNNCDDASEDDDIKASILHDKQNSCCLIEEKCNVTNKEVVTKIKKKSMNLYYNYKCNSNDNCISCLECIGKRLETAWKPPPQPGWDPFCWKCHEAGNLMPCSECVRSFHLKCLKMPRYDAKVGSGTWVCPECILIDNVINNPKRNRRSNLSQDLLNQLLSYVLKRMQNMKMELSSIQENLTNLRKYFVNPVTFESLNKRILNNDFRCGEELMNEAKWILHNVAIMGGKSMEGLKQTTIAKSILKCCRQEINEIQICPECYLNANTRSDWFVEVCNQPHLLVWAKLKGFPYWPAKVMGTGQGSFVNVRFFGEHDRAYVPVKDCYIFSEQNPNTQTNKRSTRELADCMKEVYLHIENIKNKFGKFCFSPFKTPYDPLEEFKQLEQMMPGVTDYINRHLTVLTMKPSLQYKIVKTADNNLSIIKKNEELTENEEKLASNPLINSKYEVISKVTEDESCEKVHSVILKRKSVDTCKINNCNTYPKKKSEIEGSNNFLDEEEVCQNKLRKSCDRHDEKKHSSESSRTYERKLEKHPDELCESTRILINKKIAKLQNTPLISNEQNADERKENGTCLSTVNEAFVSVVEDEPLPKRDRNISSSYTLKKILADEVDSEMETNIHQKRTINPDNEKVMKSTLNNLIGIKEEMNIESKSTHTEAEKKDCYEIVNWGRSMSVDILNNSNEKRSIPNNERKNKNNLKIHEHSNTVELLPSNLFANKGFECINSLPKNGYSLNNTERLQSSMVSIPANNIHSKLCGESSRIPITAEFLKPTSSSLNASLNNNLFQNETQHSVKNSVDISNVLINSNAPDQNMDLTAVFVSNKLSDITRTKHEEFMNSTEHILPNLAPKPNVCDSKFGKRIGPTHRAMAKNAQKLTDFFINVMESTLSEIAPEDDTVNLKANIALLQLQLERVKSNYDEEIAKIKQKTDLLITEMQCNMEEEKKRISDEIKRQCELERQRSIEETKMKQWCANCGIEAQFYCCWNTSYCDYPCQQLHWSRHASYCAQAKKLIHDPCTMSDSGNINKEIASNNMNTLALTCNSWESINESSIVQPNKPIINTSLSGTPRSLSSTQSRVSTAVQTIATNYNSSKITSTSGTASMECDISDISQK